MFNDRVKPPANSSEREQRLEKQRIEGQKAMAERRKADEAFKANFERLKAERRAREARS